MRFVRVAIVFAAAFLISVSSIDGRTSRVLIKGPWAFVACVLAGATIGLVVSWRDRE